MNPNPSPGTIAFVVDEQNSNDKMAKLVQALKQLKSHFNLELISGAQATEANLLKKIETEKYSLTLCPLRYYEAWAKIESHLGLNRTSGPTWAGYFCEALACSKLSAHSYPMRRIVFNFAHLEPSEILLLLQSLKDENKRSGIQALLQTETSIHCESWYSGQAQGQRLDYILNLEEIQKSNWIKRSNSIRILLSALWSLIYEEGPAHSAYDASQASQLRAYFQFAADSNILVFKLYYSYAKHSHPASALKLFSPQEQLPSSHPIRLLFQYADFVRVHPVVDSADLEITLGLFPSSPAEKFPNEVHSFWIETLHPRLITEAPYETPSPQNLRLKTIPVSSLKPRLAASSPTEPASLTPIILNATTKIKELRTLLEQKEETILELRSGGVGQGQAQAMSPSLPEAEELLEAFQSRFFDAQLQIRECEVEISQLEKTSISQEKVKNLQQKIDALMNRERAWIKKLLQIIEGYKKISSSKTKKKS